MMGEYYIPRPISKGLSKAYDRRTRVELEWGGEWGVYRWIGHSTYTFEMNMVEGDVGGRFAGVYTKY